MRILLTNDDGILAPGIAAMRRELVRLGEVDVVAPASPQSAAAHGITVLGPIGTRTVHVGDQFVGTAVEGRPADCVKIALSGLLPHKPDLVVSGINDGANVAINVLYSGTVAAAAEGALLGVRSVAVSLERGEDMDFDRAARIARELIEQMLKADSDRGLPIIHHRGAGWLVNLNIPAFRTDVPRGLRIVRQSTQAMEDNYTRHEGPDGRNYYFLDGDFTDTHQSDTDLEALREGYITLTPLHFDLSHEEQMTVMNQWSLDFNPAG